MIRIYQWAESKNILKFEGDQHSDLFPLAYVDIVQKWIVGAQPGDRITLDSWHYAEKI